MNNSYSSIKHSIKEVAEELGVSKQSVMKYIDKLGLRETLIVSGNAYFLSDKDKAAIKAEFERKTANQTTTKSPTNRQPNDNKTTTELSNIVELLQKNLEILQQQLAEKDKQIQALTADIEKERQHNRELAEKIIGFATTSQELTAKAQTLTAQAQQLHAADRQLLAIEKQAQQEQQIISVPEPEHKPTFWERLFTKRKE